MISCENGVKIGFDRSSRSDFARMDLSMKESSLLEGHVVEEKQILELAGFFRALWVRSANIERD